MFKSSIAIAATMFVTGCTLQTQQVQDTVPVAAPAALHETCVFTPKAQRNAEGEELGDKIADNDARQCNELVARLKEVANTAVVK